MWWQNRKLRTYSHNQQKERIWPSKKINIKKEQENKKTQAQSLKKLPFSLVKQTSAKTAHIFRLLEIIKKAFQYDHTSTETLIQCSGSH